MSFIALCEHAIATGKAIQQIAADQLTLREKELLRVAADDGLFFLSHSDRYGRFVLTSRREFVDDDPAITAHWLDAFMRLCDRGLVMHQHGRRFRLGGQGFDLARNLAKN